MVWSSPRTDHEKSLLISLLAEMYEHYRHFEYVVRSVVLLQIKLTIKAQCEKHTERSASKKAVKAQQSIQ